MLLSKLNTQIVGDDLFVTNYERLKKLGSFGESFDDVLTKVLQQVTEQDRMYKITVWDTGPGIKRENLEKLFQPFQQLEDPYSKSFEGTGLGLYYSKRLVGLYGGNIWVENEPERGSQFHFTIPRSEAH